MRALIAAAARTTVLACLALLATSVPAFAQGSPATSNVDAGYAAKQQQQMQVQPLNNQPVWSGAGGPVTIGGGPVFIGGGGGGAQVMIRQ